MSLWTLLFGNPDAKAKVEAPQEGPPELHDEEIPKALDLGWYWSKNKSQFQMAKIDEADRATHFYVIGATGTGKTKFLEFMIQQDIEKGNGFGVIDPHGDLVEEIKGILACRYFTFEDEEEVSGRVVLVDPTDPRATVTFNPLEKLPNVSVPEQVGELLSSFRKIWQDSWGPRMELLMRNSLIALGEAGFTLVELSTFLTNRSFRSTVLQKVSHPDPREYFKTRYDVLTDRAQVSWIEPVMNKIGAFLADYRIREMFASERSSFNLRDVMDSRKILLVKLDKGKLHDSSDLLGSLLMAKIKMAAFSRSDVTPSKRTPFYLYIDEFQNFASDSFKTVLSEARKYGLSFVMAHQTLAQIPEELRSLILGNAGIHVCFRLNRHDAQIFAKEAFKYSGFEVKMMRGENPAFWSFAEEWEHKTEDLRDLEPRTCVVKHKIRGGLIALQTVEMVPATDVLEMDEEEYHEFLRTVPFGQRYLVDRKAVAAAARERAERIRREHPAAPAAGKARPASAEPVPGDTEMEAAQERVSRGEVEQTEPAAVEPPEPSPPEARTPVPREIPPARAPERPKKPARQVPEAPRAEGKGGHQHKYFQTLIKQMAEDNGFKATIEKATPEGGMVDVGLERDGRKIACEISLTTSEKQELSNIEKCLTAGYEEVIVCFPEQRTPDKLKALVSEKLPESVQKKILFLKPADLLPHLKEKAARFKSKEVRVKGYKVKVQYKAVESEAEEQAKREAVARVIAETFRKMKKEEEKTKE